MEPMGGATLRIALTTLLAGSLMACTTQREAEESDAWWDVGSSQNVEEWLEFTETNYAFPADDSNSIEQLKSLALPGSSFDIALGPDDQFESGSGCSTSSTSELPRTIEGVVTLHPRYYFKSDGCDRDSDEKFYGSFFIQDKTGGIFVLGDSKVAHFDIGDHVTMSVRGTRNSFDLPMIYSHDVIEIDRGPYAMYYQERTDAFTNDDIGSVLRVEGTVIPLEGYDTQTTDTFGAFRVEHDNGTIFDVTMDSEISRRGLSFEAGQRVRVTGPMLYSYSIRAIIIMKRGQVQFLDE